MKVSVDDRPLVFSYNLNLLYGMNRFGNRLIIIKIFSILLFLMIILLKLMSMIMMLMRIVVTMIMVIMKLLLMMKVMALATNPTSLMMAAVMSMTREWRRMFHFPSPPHHHHLLLTCYSEIVLLLLFFFSLKEELLNRSCVRSSYYILCKGIDKHLAIIRLDNA